MFATFLLLDEEFLQSIQYTFIHLFVFLAVLIFEPKVFPRRAFAFSRGKFLCSSTISTLAITINQYAYCINTCTRFIIRPSGSIFLLYRPQPQYDHPVPLSIYSCMYCYHTLSTKQMIPVYKNCNKFLINGLFFCWL